MEYCRFQEKRAYIRFPVLIILNCYSSSLSRPVDSCTHDISSQGICILSKEQLALGDSVDLCMIMEDNGERVYAKGKVIWSLPVKKDKLKYRIGIQVEEADYKPISLALRAIKTRRNY